MNPLSAPKNQRSEYVSVYLHHSIYRWVGISKTIFTFGILCKMLAQIPDGFEVHNKWLPKCIVSFAIDILFVKISNVKLLKYFYCDKLIAVGRDDMHLWWFWD